MNKALALLEAYNWQLESIWRAAERGPVADAEVHLRMTKALGLSHIDLLAHVAELEMRIVALEAAQRTLGGVVH